MAVIMVCDWGGTGHYLVKDNMTNADVRSSHTIMCRVKWTVTTNNQSYFASVLCTSAATSGGFVGRLAADGAGAATRTKGARFSTTPTYNAVNHDGSFGDTTTWRHLAMVYNSTTAIVEYYIDGTSIGTVSSATTFVAADTAGAFGILAKGKIADAAIYNRALTAGEVAQMAATRALSVTSNCLGFYRMDTNSSGGTAEGNATDTSGNGNTLVANTGAGGTGFTYSTADNPPQPDYYLDSDGACTTSGTAAVSISYNFASTGATSSTGTASVDSTKALGTCSGSAATSGTAAVSMSNTVATASAATSATQIEVFRPGGQGWRAPTSALFTGGNSTSYGGNDAFSVATWAKVYRYNSFAAGLSLDIYNGTDPQVSILLEVFSGASTATARVRVFQGGSPIISQTTAITAGEWVHLAVTSDGTTIRLYADGTEFYNTPFTLGVGTTSRIVYPTISVPSSSYVDFAQFRAWKNVALSAGEVTAERAAARPVSQLSGLVWAYLLAWDNPGWDSSGVVGTYSSFNSSGGDSSNGPSSTWPDNSATGSTSTTGAANVTNVIALGSCTGSTSTVGTASVQNVVALGDCTGSASTSGAATVTTSFDLGVCTGSTSTSGAAALNPVISASASTQTTGTAAVSVAYDFASSGSAQTSATAAVSSGASIAGNASTQAAGSASVSVTYNFASSGSAQTSGAAATSILYSLAVSGSAQTSGAAAVTSAAGVVGSASSQTSGSAMVTASASIAATAATSTNGAVTAAVAAGIAAVGTTQTSGTAASTSSAGIAATGSATTNGQALTEGTLPANGDTSTQGTATFGTVVFPADSTGSSSTSGAAALTALVDVAASGSTTTAGAASIAALAGISASGSTTTDGATQFASGSLVSASGDASTNGTAALAALYDISAAGSTSSDGSVALVSLAGISAAGSASTSGTSYFAMFAAANTQTFGAVTTFTSSAELTPVGQTSTSGAAAVGLGIFPTGVSQSSGSANVTSSASLAAAGSASTYGDAAFSGVAPPVGSGGGYQSSLRRMAALLAGRRRIR